MEHKVELYVPIDKPYYIAPILAKQGDYNSRYFLIHLTEFGENIPAAAFGTVSKVAIGITRVDGQKQAFDGNFLSDGSLSLPLPLWAVERSGSIFVDAMVIGIKASGESYTIRSAAVNVYVQASGYCGDESLSQDGTTDLLTSLVNSVKELDAAITEAEAARVSAEDMRAIAEAARMDAEGERVTAEAARISAEAERVAAEGFRASAEESRECAESERVTAEAVRISAEEERVAAEAERVAAARVLIYFDTDGYPCWESAEA